jgi:hypothetical protein
MGWGCGMKSFVLLLLLCASAFCEELAEVTYCKGLAYKINGMNRVPLKVGDKLNSSDEVETDSGASMTITMPEHGVIKIFAPTRFKIPEIESNQKKLSFLTLSFGSLWCSVKKLLQGESFEIKTPTATAGVRGTVFGVQYDPNQELTEAMVKEGEIVAQNLVGEVLQIMPGMISSIGKDIEELVKNELKVAENYVNAIRVPMDPSKEALEEANRLVNEQMRLIENLQKQIEKDMNQLQNNLQNNMNQLQNNLKQNLGVDVDLDLGGSWMGDDDEEEEDEDEESSDWE